MNTHKAFILGVALLSTIGVKAQFAIDNYKAVFTSSPQHVPTTKTPDAPLAGNGDIGITMGGTPDKLCFYIGKNDFWRAYPVYPGGIALPGGLDIEIKELQGATYYAEQLPGSAEIRTKFTTPHCQLNLSAWVAATDNKIIIELQSDKAVTAHLRLWAAEEEKINFYTSMYHLFTQPNNIADIDGKYRGADDKVYTSPTGVYYSTFSLWDTYRAAHPLYTILAPEKVDGMVQTMIDHYKVQGALPIWSLWGRENYCMIGNHAIPVIVDAYLKGFKGFNTEDAYKAIKGSSMVSHRNSDWEVYNKYGYYPYDITAVESVSRTLESCYDDYCVAQMAKALGRIDDYEYFNTRAGFYKNLLDPQTNLMRGKDSKGNWRTPFNPFLLSHAATSGGDYTEGNAWQYTWHVQHDVQGLIDLIGGKKNFVEKIDSLFFLDERIEGEGFVSDVTGLIGQYAHGNEPSHHIAYLYSYADRKDKTQAIIREIFDRFYLPKPDGLCGNDDCGQMSAWYLFSAMGFYPVNPIGGEYILGAPQIGEVILKLPNNKTFTIKAEGISKENKYVKSVMLNETPIEGISIHHNDIIRGGTLVFTMTNQPS